MNRQKLTIMFFITKSYIGNKSVTSIRKNLALRKRGKSTKNWHLEEKGGSPNKNMIITRFYMSDLIYPMIISLEFV